jgi:hypothetical protein
MPKHKEMDDETWKIMVSYCGGDPYEPRLEYVEVFRESGWKTWSAETFVKMISDALKKIPDAYREAAKFEFVPGDSETFGYMSIGYNGPTSSAEIGRRVSKAADYARAKLAEERATYEFLKNKYG